MKFSEFLLTVPAFREFSQAELDALEKALVVENYPDGYEFTREGKRADSLHLVIEGKVEATQRRHWDKGVDVIETFGPGDMFGLIALIDHARRSASCTAVGPVKVASLIRSAFMLLYESNAPIALHFQTMVARQLAHDIRTYNQAVRNALRSGDTGPLYHGLIKASYEYRGPAKVAEPGSD
jgi:CRP-like cAMP-binding protein